MGGLDLTGIRAVLDDWIVDAVRVWRDNGAADDVLDEESGVLTPAGDTTIYAGPGAVQPITEQTRVDDPDSARVYETSGARYRALLPLSADCPAQVGDRLTVTAVVAESSDPELVGRTYQIVEQPGASSFAVLRVLYLKPV